MRVYFLLLMLTVGTWALGQSGKVPPFRVQQIDGKVFKAEDLPMGKPIVIIYFSPECDHCEKLTKELIGRMADFKKASVAMITYLPLDKVSKFIHQYKLGNYPNIYVGTEGSTFFLKNYYKITEMPLIALYTKNGDLIKLYPKEDSLIDVSKRLNDLK